LQAWLAADAESEQTQATLYRLFAETAEGKMAWERIAKLAAKQAALAKEMKEAWVRLERAEQLGPNAKATPKEKGGTRAAEADAAFKHFSAQERARDAKEAWERAEETRAALAEHLYGKLAAELETQGSPRNTRSAPSAGAPAPAFDPDAFLAERAPSASPPKPAPEPNPAPEPRPSWWCATNLFSHKDQICKQTKADCEALGNLVSEHWVDCAERETVTILDWLQVNRGRVFLAFPLLSQCQSMRKALLKNKIDVRAVGRCHSSAVSAP
jgi:hypothetical protein